MAVIINGVIKKISVSVAMLCACLFLSQAPAHAALSVEPENIELVVDAGSPYNGVYNVVNQGDEAVHVMVQPEDWLSGKAGKGDFPVSKWLTITPTEFDLAPKEGKEVQFTVVPPEGREGELASMVFFAVTSKDGAMNIVTRVGVSIYAAFARNMRLECAIDSVEAARFQQKADSGMVDRGIVFRIGFTNSGNVHLRPTGSIAITGEDGSKYPVNIERGFPAYPDGKGTYEVLWDKADILPGKYDALITLDYGKIFNRSKIAEKKISFTVNSDGSVSI